ncbi:hypothetical protein LJC42_01925 [Eubacteriales bacterium OttesenSCG-928-K08]|nr:hypothetical protein [Eubacteriales bacterium OttesenSCG-928-K08]
MKNTWRIIVLPLLCCFLFSACSAPSSFTQGTVSSAEERVLTDVRTQYRNASLIVRGDCCSTHINSDGLECHDMDVTEVLAGNASVGDRIHIPNGGMTKDQSYLLFLGEGEDVPHAEDVTGYTLLLDAPLPIVDSEVIWEGKRLSLNALKEELEQLGTIVSAPAPVSYYDQLDALTEAADEIFIGEIVSLPEMSTYSLSIRDGGATEKAQYEASLATIRVRGSIKGSVGRYNSELQLFYCPERVSGMLDASTLQLTQFDSSSLLELKEGGTYLFFLLNSPDAKQDYYFPINPIQGFVEISQDDLYASSSNTPVLPYDTLTSLVRALHDALDWSQPGYEEKTPPLVVGE